METDCQFISIYGEFVTSQTVSFSRADIKLSDFWVAGWLLTPSAGSKAFRGSRHQHFPAMSKESFWQWQKMELVQGCYRANTEIATVRGGVVRFVMSVACSKESFFSFYLSHSWIAYSQVASKRVTCLLSLGHVTALQLGLASYHSLPWAGGMILTIASISAGGIRLLQ